jgi:hypothetical protein
MKVTRNTPTAEQEEQELAAAELAVRAAWAADPRDYRAIMTAARVHYCGHDGRVVSGQTAGHSVLANKTALARYFEERVGLLGEGTPQSRRRRLMSIGATAKELSFMRRVA